jgi:hypothetical protein
MKKTESFIINIFIVFGFPLMCSILGWWGAATLYLTRLMKLRQIAIGNAGILGFAVGFILVVLYFKEMKKAFYTFSIRFAVVLYLFWAFAALALLRGMPLGVFLTGMVAGLYQGRRLHFDEKYDANCYRRTSRATSCFTALTAGTLTLFVGFLMLRDPGLAVHISGLFGAGGARATGIFPAGFVAVAAAIVACLQYWATKAMIYIAYNLDGTENKNPNTVQDK